jgi:hypothetical protein
MKLVLLSEKHFNLICIFLLCGAYCNESLKSQTEVDNIIMKECETFKFSKERLLCENAVKERFGIKTKYRVSAVETGNQNNQTQSNVKNEIFNFALPINTCKNEDCQFCCLSNNRCGTKRQCENSKQFMKYIHIIFIILCSLLVISLIIKCYQIDSYPDQMNSEKIDNNDLNELISMFGIIRNNRKKLIS